MVKIEKNHSQKPKRLPRMGVFKEIYKIKLKIILLKIYLV